MLGASSRQSTDLKPRRIYPIGAPHRTGVRAMASVRIEVQLV
jgi:hypothetical protein